MCQNAYIWTVNFRILPSKLLAPLDLFFGPTFLRLDDCPLVNHTNGNIPLVFPCDSLTYNLKSCSPIYGNLCYHLFGFAQNFCYP